MPTYNPNTDEFDPINVDQGGVLADYWDSVPVGTIPLTISATDAIEGTNSMRYVGAGSAVVSEFFDFALGGRCRQYVVEWMFRLVTDHAADYFFFGGSGTAGVVLYPDTSTTGKIRLGTNVTGGVLGTDYVEAVINEDQTYSARLVYQGSGLATGGVMWLYLDGTLTLEFITASLPQPSASSWGVPGTKHTGIVILDDVRFSYIEGSS